MKLIPHDQHSLRIELDLSCANPGVKEAEVPGDWRMFPIDVGGFQWVSTCDVVVGRVPPRGTVALECRPVDVSLDSAESNGRRYYVSRPITIRAGNGTLLHVDKTAWNH